MKYKVAFVCVHNSCRSQMAEAIAKKFASEVLEVYSAGTGIKEQIDVNAVKVVKELYNIDMRENQAPKKISEIPAVYIVIKMGCNISCPFLPAKIVEEWDIDDPSGENKEKYALTAKKIEEKVKKLADKVKNWDFKA